MSFFFILKKLNFMNILDTFSQIEIFKKMQA